MSTEGPVEPTPEGAPISEPESPVLPPDPSDDLEIAETLELIERKPPLYRMFRGAMYGIYLLVAAWIVIAIAVSSWRSVYGADGEALKQRAATNAPVSAKHVESKVTPPPAKTESATE